jgi:hypothetical protein
MGAVLRKRDKERKQHIIPKANFVIVTMIDDMIIKRTVNTFLNLDRP